MAHHFLKNIYTHSYTSHSQTHRTETLAFREERKFAWLHIFQCLWLISCFWGQKTTKHVRFYSEALEQSDSKWTKTLTKEMRTEKGKKGARGEKQTKTVTTTTRRKKLMKSETVTVNMKATLCNLPSAHPFQYQSIRMQKNNKHI